MMINVLEWIDPILIAPYRIAENPMAGFLVGTLALAMWTVLLGMATIRLVSAIHRDYYARMRREMTQMHNLSVRAIRQKDKASFKACNTEANDRFGRYFFAQMALGAGALWPVPFALAWMNTRFSSVDFILWVPLPGFGPSVGYPSVFVLLYILTRMLMGRLLEHRKVSSGHQVEVPEEEQMLSWFDTVSPGTSPKRP